MRDVVDLMHEAIDDSEQRALLAEFGRRLLALGPALEPRLSVHLVSSVFVMVGCALGRTHMPRAALAKWLRALAAKAEAGVFDPPAPPA